MSLGVLLYLVGSFVLVSLAGCGRGLFQVQEREPWRAEAEIACLKSGAVKENADLVRIDPISGPGVCGAEFPLKVAALGESNSSFGFADDDLRPPGNIGNQPRWPISQPPPPQLSSYPSYPARQPSYPPALCRAISSGPVSLSAPGVAPQEERNRAAGGGRTGAVAATRQSVRIRTRRPIRRAIVIPRPTRRPRHLHHGRLSEVRRPGITEVPRSEVPRLGPGPMQGSPVTAFGPVAVKPIATLACPIVSVLDHWLAESVQPAAMRWFGARVVEIKQISAYSCRGGMKVRQSRTRIFPNTPSATRWISQRSPWPMAAAFLGGGRAGRVCRKSRGSCTMCRPSACREFTTVLAPGANVYPTTITFTWI